MARSETGIHLKNIDRRLDRIEQVLPTLATKAELDEKLAAAVAPLATKAELDEKLAAAVAPLATKAELEPLATRAELLATKSDLVAEIETSRRHALVLYEDLRADIRLLAEAQTSYFEESREQRRLIQACIARDDALDLRVTALEDHRRPRPRGTS